EGIFEDVQVVAQPTIIRGLVTECQPPRLLTYTWNESNYAVATTVRFELQEHGEQVLLVLTHSRLSQEFMAAVAAGWHVNVDALLAVLKGES
ncbi:SRPBCC domain-containing protein, partial [Acinetobacter baumannii]